MASGDGYTRRDDLRKTAKKEVEMKRAFQILLLVIMILGVAGPVLAQDPIIFPAKGQNQEQMERDKFSCYQWAKQDTGFDPMKAPPPYAPPPQSRENYDALKGAALGAGAGALFKRKGSRSKGAMTGALIGGVLGGIMQSEKRRRHRRNYQQYEQQRANAYAAKRNRYNRAYAACLEAKGYVVK